MKKYATYDEVTQIFGFKKPTLYSMVCKKQIPHYRLNSRTVRFDLEELEDWIKQRHVMPQNAEDSDSE